MAVMLRVGQGYDSHRLVSGRKLILGGIEIPYELGLEGHSDADVLTHAVIDALLGAAGWGDIGEMFPPDDPHFQDARSVQLLARVKRTLDSQRWRVTNLDCTVVCQKPRLSPYKATIREELATVLDIDPGSINVKAKTAERMGALGREEGIMAQAVALLFRVEK